MTIPDYLVKATAERYGPDAAAFVEEYIRRWETEKMPEDRTNGQNNAYTWTISNLPIGSEVTFTETGYGIAGYNIASTVTQVASGDTTASNAARTSGTAHASAETTLPDSAKVAITNTYTAGVELPATGGPGTALYTVTGLTLTLGAALWLILQRKRRMN